MLRVLSEAHPRPVLLLTSGCMCPALELSNTLTQKSHQQLSPSILMLADAAQINVQQPRQGQWWRGRDRVMKVGPAGVAMPFLKCDSLWTVCCHSGAVFPSSNTSLSVMPCHSMKQKNGQRKAIAQQVRSSCGPARLAPEIILSNVSQKLLSTTWALALLTGTS